MYPNMHPFRPDTSQPRFFPELNPQPPGIFPTQHFQPSGQFRYQHQAGATAMTYHPPQATTMPYQPSQAPAVQYQHLTGQNIQYQQSNSLSLSSGSNSNTRGSYMAPVSLPGNQQNTPLRQSNFSRSYSPINQSLGSQVIVVSSRTPSSPEINPVSPMSPLLQSGIQPPLRSPLNRSTLSPDSGKQSPLVQRDFIAGMQSSMVQTDFNAVSQSPMVQKDSKAINQSPMVQKDSNAVNQSSLVKHGFIAAYKDDQNFFTTGKIEDSNRGPTAKDSYKARSFHTDVDISTKSEKIDEIAAQALQKLRTEMMKKQLEDAQRLEVDTRLMNAASKHCIKIERPSKSPKKRKHSESESSDYAPVEVEKTSKFLQEKWNESAKGEESHCNINMNNNIDSTDDENNGIEHSQILHALESKSKSYYEQLNTMIRRKSYTNKDIDDLSTPELQSPRDGNASFDFSEVHSGTTDSPYLSDANFEEDVNKVELEEKLCESEIVTIAHNIIQKAMTSALQEVRIEGIFQRAKEKHRKSLERSLYTWNTGRKIDNEDHIKSLSNSESESIGTRSDSQMSDNTDNSSNSYTPSSKTALDPTYKTLLSEVSDLNPKSPEFKPSGFKFDKYVLQGISSSVLKADVPEFIPSVIPLFVPNTNNNNNSSNLDANFDDHCEFDDEHYHAADVYDQRNRAFGKNIETQTDTTNVVDAMTNTKRTKLCDKFVETKTCDMRDIVINTVESIFDQESDFFIKDSTEGVDHGHLDVYVQTDENQNSLKLKLIDAQRQLLRTRCYTCKQQLELEKQHIRSSKYQIFTVFQQLEDRTAVNEIVEYRISCIDAEIKRLQNKLVHYEELLDLGQLFDHVPDFGLSLDLYCVNGWSMVKTETKEIQTEVSEDDYHHNKSSDKHSLYREEHSFHRRFLTEAVKEILKKLEAPSFFPTELVKVLNEAKDFCALIVEQLGNLKLELEMNKAVVNRTIFTSGRSNLEETSTSGKSVSDQNVIKKSEEFNVIPADLEKCEEMKENIENKEKLKIKKSKKSKKKNRSEQDESGSKERIECDILECGNNVDLKTDSEISGTSQKLELKGDNSSVKIEKLNDIDDTEGIQQVDSELSDKTNGSYGFNVKVNSSIDVNNMLDSNKKIREKICSLEEIDDDETDVEIDINKSDISSDYFSALSSQALQNSINTAVTVSSHVSQTSISTAVPFSSETSPTSINTAVLVSRESSQTSINTAVPIYSETSRTSINTAVPISSETSRTSIITAVPLSNETSQTSINTAVPVSSETSQISINTAVPVSSETSQISINTAVPVSSETSQISINTAVPVSSETSQISINTAVPVSRETSQTSINTAVPLSSETSRNSINTAVPLSNEISQTSINNDVLHSSQNNVAESAKVLNAEKAGLSSTAEVTPNSTTNPTLLSQCGLTSSYPVLYEAVVQQLKQVYPYLNSNQDLLNTIAAQQTTVLQMYMRKSGGSGLTNLMQPFGMTGASMPNQMSDISNPLKNRVNTDANLLQQSVSEKCVNNPSKTLNSTGTNAVNVPSENDQSKTVQPCVGQDFLENLPDISNFDNISVKSWNMNNCNSLMERMDTYLSENEDIAETKVIKPSSSPIINDSTTPLKPPGFEKQNGFSVDIGTEEILSSSRSSTCVSSKSSGFGVPSKSLNKWSESRDVSSVGHTTEVRTRHPPVKNVEKEISPQKHLDVLMSGFTFTKTLTQVKSVDPWDNPDGKKQCGKLPSLLSLPIPEKFRKLAPLNTRKNAESFHGSLSGFDSTCPKPNESEKKWEFKSSKSPTYDGPSNVPPRLQKKMRSSMNAPSPRLPLLKEPSWDDDVDDYAKPFVLNHDVRKPLDTNMNNSAIDEVEAIPLSGTRKMDDEEESKEKEKEEKEEENWCQVTKKKKKEAKPVEVKKVPSRVKHQSAPSAIGDKSRKSNNFDRLIVIMTEIFTGLSRSQIIEVIADIRNIRGGLSGLTVKEIIEIARSVVSRKFEHKMTNNQRPLEISDNNAVMCGKKKTELQHNLADYLPKPVSVSNRFDAMETAEERADRMKEYNTMKAQQAISTSGQKSINDEDDICVICHDELTFGNTKMLDCRHEFHTECINKWVYERERTCPTCRGHALFVEDFPKLGS